MLELLLLITFGGFALASHRRMKLANPFQIYFLIWFFVFFGYYFLDSTFIKVQSEFLMLLLVAKSFALLLLIIAFQNQTIKTKQHNFSLIEVNNKKLFLAAQILVFFITPFAYSKALFLSDGVDIFSVLGYIRLRSSMTQDGQGFGFLTYFFILSYILTSISVILYLAKKISIFRLLFSVVVSLFYVYLGTGRTFVVLFLCLIFVPLVLLDLVKLKGMLVFFFFMAIMFIFIASMTAKGISIDASFSENLDSFLENIRSYTIAPFLALSQFINSNFSVDLGANTFRTLFALVYELGFTDTPPIALIRDYAYVPDATNVYTVYEAYFRDFSYFGIFIPPLFLVIHWWLYRKAIRIGGIWIFYYSASVYPLVMQFFQDQYFSLLSMWVQIGFWYWLFLGARKIRFSKI